VAWAREHAIPIATIEPGRGFEDLQPLQEIIGDARIVGLGESVHGAHEFFQVRHRLLEFLVEEMGFTAFAMETGFVDAVRINVLGRPEEPERWESDWPWFDSKELWALVRWMRRYNEDASHPRKLHFYGVDVHTWYTNPLAAIEEAWTYLDEVDPGYAAESRQALLPLVEPWQGEGLRRASVEGRQRVDKYTRLPMEVRTAYTAAIADLVARFETRRVDYLGRSSEDAYEWAYRHAIVARQLDQQFRAFASTDIPTEGAPFLAEGAIARDRVMADNLLWALEREGPEGRIVLWAHNSHVQKYPHVFGDRNTTIMGEFLDSMIGDDYVSVGFTYYQGADSGWASYQTDIPNPPRPGSLDDAMALVGLPMFVLDLRSVPKEGRVYEWLNQVGEQRMSVPEYLELNPLRAWDALFHIGRISPVQLEAAQK
jgi:erythromycin esterase